MVYENVAAEHRAVILHQLIIDAETAHTVRVQTLCSSKLDSDGVQSPELAEKDQSHNALKVENGQLWPKVSHT